MSLLRFVAVAWCSHISASDVPTFKRIIVEKDPERRRRGKRSALDAIEVHV